jgi:hypothetical protein
LIAASATNEGIPLQEASYRHAYDGRFGHGFRREDLVRPVDHRPFAKRLSQHQATLAELREMVRHGPVVVGAWRVDLKFIVAKKTKI